MKITLDLRTDSDNAPVNGDVVVTAMYGRVHFRVSNPDREFSVDAEDLVRAINALVGDDSDGDE